jgi:hypothetical protein
MPDSDTTGTLTNLLRIAQYRVGRWAVAAVSERRKCGGEDTAATEVPNIMRSSIRQPRR